MPFPPSHLWQTDALNPGAVVARIADPFLEGLHPRQDVGHPLSRERNLSRQALGHRADLFPRLGCRVRQDLLVAAGCPQQIVFQHVLGDYPPLLQGHEDIPLAGHGVPHGKDPGSPSTSPVFSSLIR